MTDMSMISAQIDELRELAGDGSMEWVAGPIRASVLRDAADTIWQLRDDLQRANAENSLLRSELESVGTASYLYGRSDLKAENAKLRELVRDYERCTMHADCSRCEYDGKLSTHCPFSPCFLDADELCELGIEVE